CAPPLLEAINESYGKVFLLVQKAGPDSIKDDITLARKVLALMPILNTGGRPAVPSPWTPLLLELDAGLLSRYRKASTGLHPDQFNSIPNITIYDEFKAGMLYKLGAAAKATIKGQPANDTVSYISPDHAAELDRVSVMYGVPLGFACSADGSIALGIKLYGIPLGSVEFVALTLASKCNQITGTSQKLNSLLGLKHKQALWPITVNSTARKGGYWVQHCFPDENIDFCLGVDNAILKQASVALGCDPTTEWVAHKRLYLPTRLAGLGLPLLSETRSAAFVASAARAVTSFLDQHDATGSVTVGVLERPSIAERIGRDSFAAPGSQGWRKFGDSGSRLGAAIIATGTALRARVPPGYTGELRVLRVPPEEMGLRGKGLHGAGLQAAITSDLQQIEHETLSEQLAHRPRGDREMQLFRNISRESMIVFTVLPAGLAKVPNDEWTEISARALGLPTPACAHLVGRPLPQVSGRNTTHVDPYGDTLAAATSRATTSPSCSTTPSSGRSRASRPCMAAPKPRRRTQSSAPFCCRTPVRCGPRRRFSARARLQSTSMRSSISLMDRPPLVTSSR
ncbi:hypothetical protein T492DRAFT_1095751, partial [Pavlovales sp. CCMP2436]